MWLLAQGVDLVKAIPDGLNVVGVIVVVGLFLRQQKEFNSAFKQITEDFQARTADNQKAFQTQIERLTEDYFKNQKAFQDQIYRLMDANIALTRDAITAMNELKSMIESVVEGNNPKPLPRERKQLDK